MEPNLFSDKVYLVTGGHRGIGLAVAGQLLGYGGHVYVQDLPANPSAELTEIANNRLYYHQVDVRDRAACRALVVAIIEKHGRLDGVVNNAAICPLEGEMPSDSTFDEVVDINFRGVWNVGTAALAQMQKQGSGSIVNIGSLSSIAGVARLPGYSATKHAILGLTRTWALDFAQYGVRVNCIAPGPTDTQQVRSPLKTVMGPKLGLDKTEDEMLEMVAQSIPLKRIGDPSEVATAINFFLSDLASFITGQILCAQQQLKDRFLAARGGWDKDWEAVLRLSSAYFEAYLNLQHSSQGRGRLPPKIQEFIYIAVAACATHIHVPAVRAHIHAARSHGATSEEIMEVIGLTSLVGIHTVTLGAPILIELMEEEGITGTTGENVEHLETERARIKDAFIQRRGFWTDTWNPLLQLDPEFFESYMEFSSLASQSRAIEPKYREVIICAFDAATTHLYGRGTRIHMRNALRLGATPNEIMEMLEITSLMGMDGVTAGAGVLLAEAR
ncbi:hypothetical protein FE257_011348 [Aspergillus nanangensis]|uniref:Ketoreductase domain-containing protein n=1 Tax=Aspergillus nanangensis TaxID=2582783 RepID=A0AAD4CHI2_ASPNN|nr:hypothetical protein FE257_011348 [Aspergillus nanangensis]